MQTNLVGSKYQISYKERVFRLQVIRLKYHLTLKCIKIEQYSISITIVKGVAPLLFHKHVHDIRLLWEMNQLCWQIEYLKNTLFFVLSNFNTQCHSVKNVVTSIFCYLLIQRWCLWKTICTIFRNQFLKFMKIHQIVLVFFLRNKLKVVL